MTNTAGNMGFGVIGAGHCNIGYVHAKAAIPA